MADRRDLPGLDLREELPNSGVEDADVGLIRVVHTMPGVLQHQQLGAGNAGADGGTTVHGHDGVLSSAHHLGRRSDLV